MPEPKYDLPVYQLLKQEGLAVSRMDAAGRPVIVDKDGNEFDLPIDKMLESEGLKREEVNLLYSSPDAPVLDSPVDTFTRAKLAFGNRAGNIEYLKKQFGEDGVQFNEDHGIVVNNKGLWQTIDPDLLGPGDAWEKTKRIAKSLGGFKGNKDLAGDLAELGPEAINTVLTGIGAPIAGIAGAAAGGAAAGALRTSLGRAFGTYKATEEEQLADAGLEMLFSAGGQAIAMGAKPTMQALVQAGKNISNWGTGTSKHLLAAGVGNLTKVGSEAAEYFLENPNRLGASVTKYAKKAGDVDGAIRLAASDKVNTLRTFLDEAVEALPEKYGNLLNELIDQAGKKKLSVDMKSVVRDTFSVLDSSGLGTFDATGTKFKFLSAKEFAKRSGLGKEAELLIGPEVNQLRKVTEALSEFSRVGTLEGKSAAKALKAFEKNLNKLASSAFDGDNQQLQRLVMQVKSSFQNSVGTQFKNAGLDAEYNGLTSLYLQYGNNVREARRLLKGSGNNVEALAQHFVAPPGKKLTQQGMRDNLVDLLGTRGTELIDQFDKLHATEKFLPITPKLGFFQSFGAGAAVLQGGTVGLVAGLGAAGASVPRVTLLAGQAVQTATKPISTTVKALYKGTDFLKSLPSDKLKRLMGNDQLFQAFARPLVTAPLLESQLKEQLLQGSGAKPNGQ